LEQWVRGYDGDNELVAVIALTDMYTTFPADYGISTLWCVVGDWEGEPPFGRVCRIK
jgi:hypothetical protein